MKRKLGEVKLLTSTLNQEARTVEVMWSSGMAVRRYSWDEGAYMEELSMDPAAIRMVRFEAGMSLLDSHDSWSMKSRLGTVVQGSVRLENGQGFATVKFSRNADAEALFQDLVDGHPIQISVGYIIHSYQKIDGGSSEIPTLRAIDWEPTELSVVAVPAEPGASSRSQTRGLESMTPEEIVTAERQRQTEIRSLVRHFKIEESEGFVSAALSGNVGLNDFRAQVLEHLAKKEESSPTFPHITMRGGRDERETRVRLAVNGMLHRHGLTKKLEDGANQYRSLSIVDLARDILLANGHYRMGMSQVEVIREALGTGGSRGGERSLHSTSDFPLILGDITRQVLLDAYQGYQNTFDLIATQNTVTDLREVKVLEMGEAPQLELINEKGEYKRGTMKESQEGFTMSHYGKVIGLTEQMLINDQLGAFARALANWGRVAARLEGDIVWSVIINNMKLKSDNTALFHANHANLMTASALSKDSLVAGRKMFRLQKNIDGNPIDMAPSYLFVGTDNEVLAQTLTRATTTPATPDQVIPEAIRSMQPVYENRIDKVASTAWFLFASVADTMGRGLQYSRLSGYESPRTMERWGFDYDGVEYRLDHYFGAGLTDFRFAVKNQGA